MLRLGSLLLVATLTAVALSQTTTTANTTVASNTTVQITSTATPTTAVPPTTIPSGTPTVVNTIVIGNFGPVAGTDTFQSPSLPSGSYLPYKSDWPTVAAQVLNSYRATIAAMYPYSNLAAPTIINTQGRIFIGLSNLFANMSVTMPQVVIVIDSYEVSRAIQTSIVQSYGSSVLVIMALASSQDSNFASTAVAPATIRLAPSDQNTATNIIAAMQKLSWQAFSLVQSSDDYGDNFVASITSQITTSALAPKLLVQERLVGWGVSGRDAADEAAITRIAAGGAVGVVGCGGPGFAARVINAYLRAAAKSAAVSSAGLFFLFTPPAMMDFPQFVPPDKTSGLPFTNHAIFAPIYTNRATLTGFDTLSYAGDGLAFALSYVLDALTVVAAAAQNNFLTGQVANSTSLLRAAVALNITTGTLTGPISFDSSTNNRVQQTYNVIQLPLNPRDSATIFGTSTSSTVVLNSAASVIPQSLLTTAEICVIGSTLCSDYANVNHAIVTLLDANAATPVDSTAPRLPTGISFKIVAIATGTDGVNAISALAKYGRACDIILGPSKFSLMVAVNPLVSYYGIPTLDYGSTSPLLSDKLTYPTYARVLQPDTVMIKAMSALFVQYQWSSVGVITTKDAYGSAFLNQMTTSPVMIEKTYLVETTAGNDAAIGAAMIDIRDNLISRIIVVAMPATDSKMAALFSNIFALDSATLKTLVFYFSDAVCQYLALNPSIRARLLGSMCATPAYDAAGYATKYAQLASAYNAAALPYLTAGGFSGCSQSYTDMYSPFAHDAAWAITDTLNRMIKANGGTLKSQNATGGATILYNGTAVLASLLNTSITGATGALSFTSTADRASESYNFTIQQNGYVAILGTWTPNAGYKNTPQTTALVWQDNTTTVPTYSARGVVFIASKTASANPGVIVFSVLGFVLTVAGFVFAYKYHTMSKKMAGIELGDGPSVVVPAPTARA